MSFSLHDAEIVAYSVDLETKEIHLKVDYLEREKVGDEWRVKCKMQGEVIFSGVIAHELRDCFAQNVIFDIEEDEFEWELSEYWLEILSRFHFYAQGNTYKMEKYIKENNICTFYIGSSVGLRGIIFAEKMERKILWEKK